MIKKGIALIIVSTLGISCQNDEQSKGETSKPSEKVEETTEEVAASIRIYPKPEVAEFPGASLSLQQPMDEMIIDESGSVVPFDFMVQNYTLGAQTTDARMKLANSDKGQHIHLILDNDPYSAHYEAGFSKEVEPGHHYAIAFLSRSYHESVKNPESYQVFQFSVGMNDVEMMDLEQPALFYSRPKGTYSGEGAQKVLLDFYLHNVELSENGYKVKIVINDSEEFIVDSWEPYIIEGLPMGENKIYLELIDNDGLKVDVPINTITRVFQLEA